MPGKEPDFGATARTVAANVKRLRQTQNLNYTQLSDRLQNVADWSINAVGIRRIESGERRVTPDDLLALARALGVSPIALLMPETDTSADTVTATGLPTPVTAEVFWDWLQGFGGLYRGGDEWVEAMHLGHPSWKVRSYYEAAYETAVEENWPKGFRQWVEEKWPKGFRQVEENGDD